MLKPNIMHKGKEPRRQKALEKGFLPTGKMPPESRPWRKNGPRKYDNAQATSMLAPDFGNLADHQHLEKARPSQESAADFATKECRRVCQKVIR